MYTTPLSTLISHFLITITFTQMILNFFLVPSSQLYDSIIAHLQTARKQISWMSANLLTLNFSKTEFLTISLKQQLSKIDHSSINTTHSARNLCFIFDENLTFSDQISSLSKSCYSHICELRYICVLTLILKQPVPLLPLLSTLNLTTVSLSASILLSLK